jgi:uncharacterized membrane protein
MKKRFWEIDFLRGLAIIMMIIFHLLWDLNHFYNTGIVLLKGFWGIFQIITASLFLFLVGVSITISKIQKNARFDKYLKSGLKIVLFGLMITGVTKLVFPNNFVIFGVLHLIGISIIISYFFRKFKYLNLILGLVFIIVGVTIKKYALNFNGLLFIILYSDSSHSVDYFPIFPWLGVVLIGIFVGKLFYSKNVRQFRFKKNSNGLLVKFICFLGKKSLIIYLLHQIVLYGLFLTIITFL